ncbi:hypothetical protein OWM07_06455 [Deferribacter thermophilus]|uniref:hypothetical protein n=1 Tax=Deferribacter thermophilus TaxID=53573 RepID=UPI003C250F25
MIDKILIFISGMILGGFIYVQVEHRIKNRITNLKKFGQIVTFLSIMFISINYLTLKHTLIYGIFAGTLIFSFIPQLVNNNID